MATSPTNVQSYFLDFLIVIIYDLPKHAKGLLKMDFFPCMTCTLQLK